MKIVTGFLKMLFLILWSLLAIAGSMILTFATFERSIALDCGRKIWAPILLWVYGVKIEVTGREKISKKDTFILISNHSSYLDIPVLFSVMPFNLYFVAKHELGKIPFLGFYLRRVEMILIDRSNRQASAQGIESAGRFIRNGRTVAIFPEGTSKGGGEIGEFKKGGFHLARAAKVPILPVRIIGTEKIWPNHKKAIFNSGVVQVIIGDPVLFPLDTKMDLNNAVKETKSLIENL